MRMDRYEEEDTKEKLTRTNKNQELYTDVYLNNAYVDISDLKEVMEEELPKEEKKVVKEEYVPYNYEEKNYDIVAILEEVIKTNGDNKEKRSLENDEEIENIIESINEVQREKNSEETLLSDLMPDRDTEVMPPLENPILDTSIMDTSIIHKDEMSNDLMDIEEENQDKNKNVEESMEIDDSFANEVPFSKKKLIFIIIGIVLLIAIVVGILIWKKVIKF